MAGSPASLRAVQIDAFACEAGEKHGQERWGDSAGRTIPRQGGVRADCTDLEADALMKARA